MADHVLDTARASDDVSSGQMARDVQVGQQAQYVLITAVKNEAPFLLEWIAYHTAIGFERIVVFSNDSDDGTTELLDALHQEGVIEHHPHTVPKGVSPQGNAARLINETGLIRHGDWVLWIDADEFLNIHIADGHVSDLVALIGQRKGMLIQWRLFGDSGNAVFPGRFISSDFTQASRPRVKLNLETKSFFRNGPEFAGLALNGINRPILKKDNGLTTSDFLNGNGVPILESGRNERWLLGDDFAGSHSLTRGDLGGQVAQINHYCVRTPDVYALKRSRGRGWAAGQAGATNKRHTDDFYQKMNRNGVEDRSILRHQKAVDARMAAFLEVPAIRKAHDRGLRLTAAAVARAVSGGASQEAPEFTPRRFEVTLPAQEQDIVKSLYADAETVLEYGSGGSSFLALDLGVKRLFTVENDPAWAETLDLSLSHYFPDASHHVHYVNTGVTEAWGRHVDQSGRDLYPRYATSIWEDPLFQHPDVVLVDGRFRVACFWATLIHAKRPVTLLFDDYHDRSEYHWIEEVVAPTAFFGRMAKFDLTPGIPFQSHLGRIIRSFYDEQ